MTTETKNKVKQQVDEALKLSLRQKAWVFFKSMLINSAVTLPLTLVFQAAGRIKQLKLAVSARFERLYPHGINGPGALANNTVDCEYSHTTRNGTMVFDNPEVPDYNKTDTKAFIFGTVSTLALATIGTISRLNQHSKKVNQLKERYTLDIEKHGKPLPTQQQILNDYDQLSYQQKLHKKQSPLHQNSQGLF